jgi:hypothetical protein
MTSLSEFAKTVDQQYQRHFAGHPRFSRDASLLRRMAADVRGRIDQEQVSEGRRTILDKLASQAKLFEDEATQIEGIQSSTPEDFLAHEYRSWIDLVFDRYRRSFAGQNRSERDLHLLRSLRVELEKVDGRLAKLAERRSSDVISETQRVGREHATLFESEFGEIARLRDVGEVPQQTSMLANDANRLFTGWGDYFGGKSRVSRRLERLELMIEHLGWIDEKMSALEGEKDPDGLNRKNREICAQRKSFYETELQQIRQARSQTGFDDIVLSLGESANQAFATYREVFAGKDRQSVPLAKLNIICEELFDLAVQMNELDMVRSHDANQQNLSTVLDQLRLFQREYDTIRKTQENV